MQELIRKLLAEMGEDPAREGLRETPKRVEKAYKFLTSGYDADIDRVLNNALFAVDYSEMVIVKDIDFYSLCEHHLLPFFGKCHVAYIPSDKVIGLSKIPRLVDVFSRRLQVQERLTNQIADTLRDKIAPVGVAVVMEATHLCMSMRGVEKQNSFAVTSAMQGAFRTNARTRWVVRVLAPPGARPPGDARVRAAGTGAAAGHPSAAPGGPKPAAGGPRRVPGDPRPVVGEPKAVAGEPKPVAAEPKPVIAVP